MIHPLIAEYGTYHRDPRNRMMHEIGIPLIVLAIVVLLALVKIGPVDLAQITIALVFTYYVRIDRRAALAALLGLLVLYLIGIFIPWWLAIGLFALGWVFQFVGHAFEGKKPAFLTNIAHLLVGPLWIAALALHRTGDTAAE